MVLLNNMNQNQNGNGQQPNLGDAEDDDQMGNGFGNGAEDDEGEGDSDEQLMNEAFNLLNDDEDEDGDFDGDDEDEDEDDASQMQQALRNEILEAVKGITVTEDMIPEDFDPSDSKQLRGVLNTVQQNAALKTMGIMFKPIQAAMTRMGTSIQKEMDNKIREATQNLKQQSVLEEMVPEIHDKEVGPLVRQMDKTFKAKGKKPLERAKLIRAALTKMNLSGKGSGGNGNSNRNSNRRGQDQQNAGGFKTGSEALDLFMPMPKSRNKR